MAKKNAGPVIAKWIKTARDQAKLDFLEPNEQSALAWNRFRELVGVKP